MSTASLFICLQLLDLTLMEARHLLAQLEMNMNHGKGFETDLQIAKHNVKSLENRISVLKTIEQNEKAEAV